MQRSNQFALRPGCAAHPKMWDKHILCGPWALGIGGTRHIPDLSPSRYDGVLLGSAAAVSMVASPIGPAFKVNGNAGVQWTASSWGLPTKIGAGDGTALTIQMYFRYTHKASSHQMVLYRSDQPGVGDGTFYGYLLMIDANNDSLWFATNTASGGGDPDPKYIWKSSTGTPATNLTPGKWHHAFITYFPLDVDDFEIAQFCMMCIDGTWLGPGKPATESGSGPVHSSSKNARLGGRYTNDPDFEVALLNIWNRRMPWREIDQLMADPLRMFRRRAGAKSKASRLVSIGGTALRRMNVAVAG